MIKIFLKDGKTIEVEKGSKVAEIASKLSISLGKKRFRS